MTRILLISFLVASISDAQWSTDPANNLIVGYGEDPQLASDSAGGCYITYTQLVGLYNRLYLERLNRFGYKPWGTRRQIVGELPGQDQARITEDGLGGVVVSYTDYLLISPKDPAIYRLRVQRIDSSGNLLWESAGVRVSLSETPQGPYAIVSDGAGGCIVAWVDADTASEEYHLRINRINSTGVRAWGDSGRFVWNYGFQAPDAPRVVRTFTNDFVVAFGSLLKKYTLSGNPGWGGQPVNVGFGTRSIIADRDGGVIVYDGTGTSSNILIVTQKIDSSGLFLWNNPYILLDDSAIFNVRGNPISLNADGTTTFAWRKRVGSVGDVHVQLVRTDGSTIFSFGGQLASTVTSEKEPLGILPSESPSSVFVWGDFRSPTGTYAQRLDTSGLRLWDSTDIVVSFSQPLKVVTDGNGGFIAIVSGQNFAIRAQQVNKYGQLGQVITSVEGKVDHDFPKQPILYQNYPNPFNPQTTIRFQLPRAVQINLTLYNILGQNIKTLASGIREAGVHSVILEADNLPSGTYLYRLTTPQAVLTHKLLIIK